MDGYLHTARQRLWARPFGPVEYAGRCPGTRGTPTVDGDRVYVVGASGQLACLDRQTGDVQWAINFRSRFDSQVIGREYSESIRDQLRPDYDPKAEVSQEAEGVSDQARELPGVPDGLASELPEDAGLGFIEVSHVDEVSVP